MSQLFKELVLIAATNEAFSKTFELKTKDSAGTIAAMDLTDHVFKAEIKATRSTSAAVLATMTCTIEGDPTLGILKLALSEAQVSALGEGRFYYDLLYQNNGGATDNLWISEFNVKGGVTTW